MQIPDHKIEEIRERADIVSVVSRYVELKKSGRSYTGLCPFHNEKTPSFNVIPDLRIFKCFGCQAGGDVFSFLQRYLGKGFLDTVKDLAREVGVNVEAAYDPEAKERAQLREVTDFAAEHFKARLWDAEKGKKARAYLEGRGVTEAVSRAFGLGWAPMAWSELADALLKAGMIEWGERAGLVSKRQRGEGYYDMFRGRLIIPIRGPDGRTIAFGGRLLEGEDGPKYLNSRESRLYNKSETLYGMDQARDEIRRRKVAVLVEGYFDCIGMQQAGVKNAVALCSTALTPGHLNLLTRGEAKELILLLDGDEAGRKAVERLSGPLLARGMATKVALLPEGEDPDTFARKAGEEGVQRLLGTARPLTEHLFTSILPQGPAASFEAKMQAIERLKPITTQVPLGLTRSAFFGALAIHTGLPASELESTLRGKAPPPRPVPKPAPAAVAAPPRPERPPHKFEAMYAAAVLRDPSLIAKDTTLTGDEVRHPGVRALLAQAGSEDALLGASELVRRAIEGAARDLPPPGAPLDEAFAGICRRLKLARVEEQLDYMARITGQYTQASELPEEVRKLLAQRPELVALRERLKEKA